MSRTFFNSIFNSSLPRASPPRSLFFKILKNTTMKLRKIFPVSLLAMLVIFLSSCNSGSETTTATDSMSVDADTATATTTAPETNVITTPENILTVRHKVKDFAKWKTSYDEHDSMRLANGIHNYVIGRGVNDSSMVLVAVKCDDLAKAKAFSKDASLKTAMQKGGVTGTPSFKFSTVVYQDMAPNMSDLRSMTTFTVKDWDAWKTSFESNRQLRTDNGLTDRAYGYDVDDNHKVTLVVAVNDSAKAEAFWKGDVIKQRRAESGVISEPERFVYRVVQKY